MQHAGDRMQGSSSTAGGHSRSPRLRPACQDNRQRRVLGFHLPPPPAPPRRRRRPALRPARAAAPPRRPPSPPGGCHAGAGSDPGRPAPGTGLHRGAAAAGDRRRGWEGAPGKQPRQPAACRAHAAISRPPGATAQPPHPLRRHGGAPGARSVRGRSKRRAPLHEALLLPRRPPPPPPPQQQQRRRASRGGHPAAGPACTTAAEGRRRLGPGWAARAAWWRRQPAGTTSRRGSGVVRGFASNGLPAQREG